MKDAITIIKLYLEKRDKMDQKERAILLESIHLINTPIYSSVPNIKIQD